MYDIPLIDIRDEGPLALVRSRTQSVRRLIEASRDSFGIASRIASYAALPFGDYVSKALLERTGNPYLSEIEEASAVLGQAGVFALNLCYEWGCTSGAYQKDDGVVLARVLDWVFPALAENVVVAHQAGAAGDFYNVTWPGVIGALTGMARGRFSVALNQAPMRMHRVGPVVDWVVNRFMTMRSSGLPPMHLMRRVLETAYSYDEAKEMLTGTPVALPVIYTLTGIKEGQGCVIERTETQACVRPMEKDRVCTANHFVSALKDKGCGWRPRPIDSFGRLAQSQALPVEHVNKAFAWLKPPILNAHTRIAVYANAATGELAVRGFYGDMPLTNIFEV